MTGAVKGYHRRTPRRGYNNKGFSSLHWTTAAQAAGSEYASSESSNSNDVLCTICMTSHPDHIECPVGRPGPQVQYQQYLHQLYYGYYPASDHDLENGKQSMDFTI